MPAQLQSSSSFTLEGALRWQLHALLSLVAAMGGRGIYASRAPKISLRGTGKLFGRAESAILVRTPPPLAQHALCGSPTPSCRATSTPCGKSVANMPFESVWNAHPKDHGKGSRRWCVGRPQQNVAAFLPDVVCSYMLAHLSSARLHTAPIGELQKLQSSSSGSNMEC